MLHRKRSPLRLTTGDTFIYLFIRDTHTVESASLEL